MRLILIPFLSTEIRKRKTGIVCFRIEERRMFDVVNGFPKLDRTFRWGSKGFSVFDIDIYVIP